MYSYASVEDVLEGGPQGLLGGQDKPPCIRWINKKLVACALLLLLLLLSLAIATTRNNHLDQPANANGDQASDRHHFPGSRIVANEAWAPL